LFRADPRLRDRQRYCSAADCRRASKAASQRRWLDKPENRDYFRGPEQVARVQAWRRAHPGYARRRAVRPPPLQEERLAQVIDNEAESGIL